MSESEKRKELLRHVNITKKPKHVTDYLFYINAVQVPKSMPHISTVKCNVVENTNILQALRYMTKVPALCVINPLALELFFEF